MRLSKLIPLLGRQKDIYLVSVFALVLVMLILPLPAVLMDVLITVNISASIIIILISLQLHNPLQFSTFPSLLLVSTLFRLGISISTTRLILIDGNAGEIVATFGEVVVGGNLVVGLVIFLIITVVQFLVITKGADRVAEVGARFTLDGLPGKQMSIDADLRVGNIDQLQAREARQSLEREAKLFGSMDGAMKFVKGDAIAGLVIIAINLLGGITIGMAQRGLSFGDALELYALLTVGDGLIAQIPALLISVAAGNILTRVVNPEGIDLGTEISRQVSANGRTIVIAGLLIAMFGLVPGFPTVIFVLIGSALAGGVLWGKRKRIQASANADRDWYSKFEAIRRQYREYQLRTGSQETVKIRLPPSIRTGDVSLFCATIDHVRRILEEEYGVLTGYWLLEIAEASVDRYEIFIQQEMVGAGQLKPTEVFVKANQSYLEILGISCTSHFGAREGAYVSEAYVSKLREEGIEYWSATEQLCLHIKRVVAEQLEKFASVQHIANMLAETGRSHPALASDLRDNVSNSQISAVLKMLLRERLPIVNRVRILEAILEWSLKRPDPYYILQNVRVEISDLISKRFAPDGFLPAIVIAPTLESCLREGMRNTTDGSFVLVEPSISTHMANQAKRIVSDGFILGRDPVLLSQKDIRQVINSILAEYGIYIPVLSYQEIDPNVVIYPVGYLSIEPDATSTGM
ncbi:flagellar biosynthesis protein FlhA [Ensifer sp. SL37]|uniref:flagellar biosynthesis protein FlhA n=1 Tax=Ensifer sp. SL37 TaxID=2995137 RepID=UPI002274B04E|nr:flagellar biosynthesis protein FlhA [Ensifer sp. SL37]MCY1740490.1 flagellar biosynthesis protein FlhA [Ensifer sp. SL37]